ncbi:unnamed protein product [Ambrosiozyma monospora]|uniref:Unnamed protein product n=1 Tax=Ambrosiozyma monospora TaxID=43982 RepID=A0ACB5T821_AMBMO|nr:unnamed protein product [Ambrosiozyma monospora]
MSSISTAFSKIPTFKLARTGHQIPALAHVYKKIAAKEDVAKANEDLTQLLVDSVTYAGITHLDTAEIYTTEPEVGNAVKRCGVDRSRLWITSKYNSGWDIPGEDVVELS